MAREGWLTGKQFQVTPVLLEGFKKNKLHWECLLCGHEFVVGDNARFIWANHADSPFRYGNFFVCGGCDAGDCTDRYNQVILRRARAAIESLLTRKDLLQRAAGSCHLLHAPH